MEAKELRVGNLVYDNLGGTLKIKGISLESDLSHLKPIPLTEEWLVKFGFDKKYHKDKFTIIPKGKLNYKNGRTYFNSWAILDYQPEYVHQLQNLYYALTNKELTI